jgi:hypothetical protein
MRLGTTQLGCWLAFTCLALVAGCGTGAPATDAPTPSSAAPAVEEHRATPRASPSPPPTATAEPEETPQDRADAAVLRRDDVGGAGWEEEDVPFETDSAGGDPEQRSDNPACHHGQEAALLDPAPDAKARTGWYFTNTEAAETVISSAYVYSSEELAQQAQDSHVAAASACLSWNAGGVDGTGYAFSHQQTTYPVVLGAAAFGVEESVGSIDVTDIPRFSTYVVVARTGDVIQTTSFVSTLAGAPGMSMVLGHAQSAAAHLQR